MGARQSPIGLKGKLDLQECDPSTTGTKGFGHKCT